MILLLDFDSTLFDTALYKKETGIEGIPYKEDPSLFWNALSFNKDLSRFLFTDTRDFLTSHHHYRRVLVTFGDKVYQKTKVTQSGILHLFEDTIFTGDEMKGGIIKRAFPETGEKIFFLDDDVEQLQSMRTACPYVVSVRMRRKNVVYNSTIEQKDFPEVSDLKEFAQLLKSF